MAEAHHAPGDTFPIQFAWRLPSGGYLRAVFELEVIDLASAAEKYVGRLNRLLAGREETPEGESLDSTALSRDYWAMVGNLIGHKITVAYEVDDGRALYLRLETLTGEHNYFTRYEDAEVIARGLAAQSRRSDSTE